MSPLMKTPTVEPQSRFHLENYPGGGGGGGGGGQLEESGLVFKGGMMVNDVTKFHKCHLEGRGMLEFVCVQGFIQDFLSFRRGRIPKFGVNV